eukprot:15161873-Alexandrium_andersonii.AAC.1
MLAFATSDFRFSCQPTQAAPLGFWTGLVWRRRVLRVGHWGRERGVACFLCGSAVGTVGVGGFQAEGRSGSGFVFRLNSACPGCATWRRVSVSVLQWQWRSDAGGGWWRGLGRAGLARASRRGSGGGSLSEGPGPVRGLVELGREGGPNGSCRSSVGPGRWPSNARSVARLSGRDDLWPQRPQQWRQ